ncbi:MAG: serine/threonine-protein kinase [Myxococcales bacterium]|jgi:serine/threonine-protein kinase
MGKQIGERLGAYVTTAHLADGAMSSVYAAQHRQTGASVALKVLRPDAARDPVAVERFHREYETAMALQDEHIVEVLDFGRTESGAPFIVMELLRGETLAVLLGRHGALSPPRVVRIACQLALALRCAHAEGVVHRDLKPGNIFVCQTDRAEAVRVLDFGSVKLQVSFGPKLTALGTTVGSPCYMSPEQAMGRPDVDPRSDLFSFAAIVYEMTTGEVAFGGDSVGEVLSKIIEGEPPPVSSLNPGYPSELDGVIRRGLSKDKAGRFSSATELAEAVLVALRLPAEIERWARADQEELTVPRSATAPPVLHRVAGGERGFGPRTTIPPK